MGVVAPHKDREGHTQDSKVGLPRTVGEGLQVVVHDNLVYHHSNHERSEQGAQDNLSCLLEESRCEVGTGSHAGVSPEEAAVDSHSSDDLKADHHEGVEAEGPRDNEVHL